MFPSAWIVVKLSYLRTIYIYLALWYTASHQSCLIPFRTDSYCICYCVPRTGLYETFIPCNCHQTEASRAVSKRCWCRMDYECCQCVNLELGRKQGLASHHSLGFIHLLFHEHDELSVGTITKQRPPGMHPGYDRSRRVRSRDPRKKKCGPRIGILPSKIAAVIGWVLRDSKTRMWHIK